MHIFRYFFVSTVLIPVLLVVAVKDQAGGRQRRLGPVYQRSRNVVISEDGTRTGRRLNPMNMTEKSGCPSLGCSGNLTSMENGKGSIAKTLKLGEEKVEVEVGQRSQRLEHRVGELGPLKLNVKVIRNSTRGFEDDVGTGRDFYDELAGLDGWTSVNPSVAVSWSVWLLGRAAIGFFLVFMTTHAWWVFRRCLKWFGVTDDYVETYVKLGKDDRHPFGGSLSGWNPVFGVSLKSKLEKKKEEAGWGWEPAPGHHHGSGWGGGGGGGWMPPDYGWGDYGGWPSMSMGWNDKGWKDNEDLSINLRHKYDKKKGWKLAQKYTKKYGKKAHKYGLRPSYWSYMYDKKGNIQLDNQGMNFAWRRKRSSSAPA